MVSRGAASCQASVLAAVNHEYAELGQAVHDGDEVAFFPARYRRLSMAVRIVSEPPSIHGRRSSTTSRSNAERLGGFGATAVFVGTMRDFNDGECDRDAWNSSTTPV